MKLRGDLRKAEGKIKFEIHEFYKKLFDRRNTLPTCHNFVCKIRQCLTFLYVLKFEADLYETSILYGVLFMDPVFQFIRYFSDI